MSTCTPGDRLLQTILVQAPGTTEAVVRLHMFNVMDEFFRRTSVWRYQADLILEEEVTEYSYGIPEESVFVRMLEVTHNGVPVSPTQVAGGSLSGSTGRMSADLTFPDGDAIFFSDISDKNVGTGIFSYAIYKPQTVTITVPPSAEQVKFPLIMVVALSIARECLECECTDWQVPDWMYDMFFQDWLDGILSRLFMMPGKPWTSKELFGYHGKRFRQAMAQRKVEANKGFVYNKPGWVYPRTGGWV